MINYFNWINSPFLPEYGNVLWGCTTFVDDAIEEVIRNQGGIAAIAISHPHELYSYAKWAVMFNSPVVIHERDKDLIEFNSDFITTWSGEEFPLAPHITLIRLGGHYDGGAVLHWNNNQGVVQDGKGVLLCSDMLQVGIDGRTVSIMRSYNNCVPLSGVDARRIRQKLSGVHFDRMYASGNHRDLLVNAKRMTLSSLSKYAAAIERPREDVDGRGFLRIPSVLALQAAPSIAQAGESSRQAGESSHQVRSLAT
ncbi:hypothetical protein R1flu_013813 [Riccia fluitans]|uniref:Uncharacterized protein n=1 Tax=Riccia fluitans TaxID=41844 RepID=A0ABD1YHG1_9MARC